jgi:hypothetical protein
MMLVNGSSPEDECHLMKDALHVYSKAKYHSAAPAHKDHKSRNHHPDISTLDVLCIIPHPYSAHQ